MRWSEEETLPAEVRGGLSKWTADLLKYCDWRDLRRQQCLEQPKWWELGFFVSHSRPLITHPAAPPATNCWGTEGVPSVWPLSRATTSSFGHITAPTVTFVIIHGYLCITGRTGAAVLCTCNSTSSQSPEEGSGQEGVCQQAGHTGHMQANRGTSEIDQFTISLCFFLPVLLNSSFNLI